MNSSLSIVFEPGSDVRGHITPDLLRYITAKATERRDAARAKNRKQMEFVKDSVWDSIDTEIQSMAAEFAVAYYFGQTEYEPVIGHPDRKQGDLIIKNKPIEVKSTSREHGCLVVRKNALARPYVLVVSNPPDVHIVGWFNSEEAKVEKYWRENVHSPAYFVPQSDLLPINYLEDAI